MPTKQANLAATQAAITTRDSAIRAANITRSAPPTAPTRSVSGLPPNSLTPSRDNSPAQVDSDDTVNLDDEPEEERTEYMTALDNQGLDHHSPMYIHQQAQAALTMLNQHVIRDGDQDYALVLALYLVRFIAGDSRYKSLDTCWNRMWVAQRNALRNTSPCFDVVTLLPLAMRYYEHWLSESEMRTKLTAEADQDTVIYQEELQRYQEEQLTGSGPRDPSATWRQRLLDMSHWTTYIEQYPFVYYVARHLPSGIMKHMLSLFHHQHDKGRSDDIAVVSQSIQAILLPRFPTTGEIPFHKAARGYHNLNTARAMVPFEYIQEMDEYPERTMARFNDATYKHVGGDLPAFLFARQVNGKTSRADTFGYGRPVTQTMRVIQIGKRSLQTGAFIARNCNAVRNKVELIKHRHWSYAAFILLYCLSTADKMVLSVGTLDLMKFHNTLISMGYHFDKQWHTAREQWWNRQVFGAPEGRTNSSEPTSNKADVELGRWTTSQLLLRDMGVLRAPEQEPEEEVSDQELELDVNGPPELVDDDELDVIDDSYQSNAGLFVPDSSSDNEDNEPLPTMTNAKQNGSPSTPIENRPLTPQGQINHPEHETTEPESMDQRATPPMNLHEPALTGNTQPIESLRVLAQAPGFESAGHHVNAVTPSSTPALTKKRPHKHILGTTGPGKPVKRRRPAGESVDESISTRTTRSQSAKTSTVAE